MTDENSLVSVVVPVGSVDGFLPLQLDTLVGQTYTGRWELVLSLNSADPGERARLEDLLGERPSLPSRIVDSSALRSASHARNVGAREAEGDLLLFCDGDDLADPDWMVALVAAMDGVAAVGGHLEEEKLAIEGQEDWRPPATPGALPTFLGSPFLVTANMAVERTAFEKVGGFDTTLIRGEDIAFSWGLLDLGLELAYAADAVIHYRHRRGMVPMMRQHYLYGKGFSQILARRGVPHGEGASVGLKALKPNGQAVTRKGVPYFARRGSIAAGRLVGLLEERARR
ncbi:MAG: glycosyltransferase [Actinomycetota bacterium]